jgi:hypothetical protein
MTDFLERYLHRIGLAAPLRPDLPTLRAVSPRTPATRWRPSRWTAGAAATASSRTPCCALDALGSTTTGLARA